MQNFHLFSRNIGILLSSPFLDRDWLWLFARSSFCIFGVAFSFIYVMIVFF